MDKLKIAQIAFLTDTAKHFNFKNRGIKASNGHDCSYAAGCAIGRHIPNKELCRKLDKYDDSGAEQDRVFKQFPIKLRRLGKDFLAAVQRLHDRNHNWNESGLTELGLVEYDNILQNILSDKFPVTATNE